MSEPKATTCNQCGRTWSPRELAAEVRVKWWARPLRRLLAVFGERPGYCPECGIEW